MQKTSTRLLSVLLSVIMLLTLVPSDLVSYAAEVSLNITDENGNDINEIQQLTEYKTLQLKYTTTGELPEGTTVKWESNLPLIADVDDNGKVTAYDSSKTAIIQLWLDENAVSYTHLDVYKRQQQREPQSLLFQMPLTIRTEATHFV